MAKWARPLGQFSHVQASLAGLCHLGAHYCHLPAGAAGSSEVFLHPSLRRLPLCPWHLSQPGQEEQEAEPGDL